MGVRKRGLSRSSEGRLSMGARTTGACAAGLVAFRRAARHRPKGGARRGAKSVAHGATRRRPTLATHPSPKLASTRGERQRRSIPYPRRRHRRERSAPCCFGRRAPDGGSEAPRPPAPVKSGAESKSELLATHSAAAQRPGAPAWELALETNCRQGLEGLGAALASGVGKLAGVYTKMVVLELETP